MNAIQILEKLKSKFPDAILDAKVEGVIEPYAKIKPELIKEVCQFMRDDEELNFDYLMCLSGMDYGKGVLGVVYNLNSIKHKHKFTLKVEVASDAPNVPSIESIWKTANWHEREAYDMFGIIFIDHPDLRRMLLPDDWEGHPLRKDYQVQEFYHGMKVPY
ncbi:MAG: NADH-ubiquinone oxidoreductase chain C [Ignavibacteriae bacterium]|nr:MAG: NADH-ubiquinone oxidoreductase chain C [Ignavibacteriota bacterium]